jgi:hypothetical protein
MSHLEHRTEWPATNALESTRLKHLESAPERTREDVLLGVAKGLLRVA